LVWHVTLAFFHVFVVVYEEPTLTQTFGIEYEAYRADVPRWIPRLTPWRDVRRWNDS
jgi:protein-S-isoprenylcysteine O-methyltransferase Ste14